MDRLHLRRQGSPWAGSGPGSGVVGAINEIGLADGGRIEAIAEVTHGRTAQPRFLFSATAELFESLDFTRGRQIGKHAWVLSRTVASTRRETASRPVGR